MNVSSPHGAWHAINVAGLSAPCLFKTVMTYLVRSPCLKSIVFSFRNRIKDEKCVRAAGLSYRSIILTNDICICSAVTLSSDPVGRWAAAIKI